MDLIRNHPANARVIRSLCGKHAGEISIVAPEQVPDPYYECGSHPEVVEQVWDKLSKGMPQECRRVLCGTPVLVQPATGLILAVGCGTSYCIRVSADKLESALALGYSSSECWSNGHVFTLAEELGENWVFGNWDKREAAWIQA